MVGAGTCGWLAVAHFHGHADKLGLGHQLHGLWGQALAVLTEGVSPRGLCQAPDWLRGKRCCCQDLQRHLPCLRCLDGETEVQEIQGCLGCWGTGGPGAPHLDLAVLLVLSEEGRASALSF